MRSIKDKGTCITVLDWQHVKGLGPDGFSKRTAVEMPPVRALPPVPLAQLTRPATALGSRLFMLRGDSVV